MKQETMALIAIAVVIPIAMIWVAYSGGLLSSKSASESASSNNSTQILGGHTIQVTSSFYPLYDFAKHVGGNKATVTSMVPIGVEPHDWEPTIQQVLQMRSADLFVYNGAGIDKWAEKIETRLKVNASEGLPLLTDNKGNPDPHTWLDPVLAKRQVELIRNGLVKADPQNTDYYIQNAKSYTIQLNALDAKIKSELSTCTKSDFISFHSAFSYFSNRYGLHQHTILGNDPEGDIPPHTLSDLIRFARQYGIHVIYSEDLLDPRNAQVIASEIPNGEVLVLSPIEGIKADEKNAGIGYLEKMQRNLENLRVGLDCT